MYSVFSLRIQIIKSTYILYVYTGYLMYWVLEQGKNLLKHRQSSGEKNRIKRIKKAGSSEHPSCSLFCSVSKCMLHVPCNFLHPVCFMFSLCGLFNLEK